MQTTQDAYDQKAAAEIEIYAGCDKVHNLPDIFHYWSHTYLKPKFDAMAIRGMNEFFEDWLFTAAQRIGSTRPAFLSVGSGNCDIEVGLAVALKARGLKDFQIECLELNPSMLARGLEMARQLDVEAHLVFTQADFNRWTPSRQYDAVMANQSLHHVLELEHLFDAVRRALLPQGLFVVSDMIGRNGHMRWPEALSIVHEFWVQMPRRYRNNLLLKRYDELYEDWDCSKEGFEGIRAQDVLPNLASRFQFELFLPFSNVVDIFIDRAFGHHFAATGEWDCHFIDRVEARDDAAINRGEITPTHMLAVMALNAPSNSRIWNGLTPGKCIRKY